MKIGQRSNFRIEQLTEIKESGFDCIDYSDFLNVEKQLYQISDAEFEETMKEQKRVIDSVGLLVWQAHGPWRYPPRDNDPAEREKWLRCCRRAIRGCALLGCKYFVIHPLMPFGAVDEDPALVKSLNLEFFRALCAEGEKNGVVICMENMPFGGQIYARVAPMLEFIKEVNSPCLKACLDTGHSACLGDSPTDAVYLLGKEYLATMHVHDNDGTRDQHLEPGRGVIDWDAFRKALADIGFDGTLSIESNVPKELSDEERAVYPSRIADIAKQLAKDI